MASTMIHIVVASEINKKLKRDEKKLFIGTIAPDISKLIGENKVKSHFLGSSNTNNPDLYKFLSKYKENLDDDFVLGYYIHLFTDFLWFKYFVTDFWDDEFIIKLDGSKINCNKEEFINYLYNDYTNLNIKLIDEYNLNLKIFYLDLPKVDSIIEEIPMDKLNLIVDQAGIIIKNSKKHKEMTFNINGVKKFITFCVNTILGELSLLNIK